MHPETISTPNAPTWEPSDATDIEPLASPEATAPATKPDVRSPAVRRLLAIGAFVLVAGLGFAAGRMAGGASSGIGQSGNGQNGGQPGFAAGYGIPGGVNGGAVDAPGFDRVGGPGMTIQGTVESVGSDGTLTIKLANGSTVTIGTSSTTTYHGQQTASQSDVTAGKTVTVQLGSGTASGTTGSTTRTAADVTITGN